MQIELPLLNRNRPLLCDLPTKAALMCPYTNKVYIKHTSSGTSHYNVYDVGSDVWASLHKCLPVIPVNLTVRVEVLQHV